MMFLVKPDTVDLLFRAQRPHLRGRLRLDLSSRRFPRDVRQSLDRDAAREALGERLLRLLLGLANDAQLLGQDPDWKVPPPAPPVPDADSRLRVMPDPTHFEPYVEARIDEQTGLDPNSPLHLDALVRLADNFYQWVADPASAADAAGYGLHAQENQVFIRCQPYPVTFVPGASFSPGPVTPLTPKAGG